MADLILASGSSRRKELLEQIGVQFSSVAMDIDETPLEAESPEDYVERMATEKAIAAIQKYPENTILASDTSVICEGSILGKPESEEDAKETLRLLSGRSHHVLTAIAMVVIEGGKNSIETQVVSTQVDFYDLSEEQIVDYVATGESMDKAGAYGIQGKGALLVKGINGSTI